MSNRNRLTVSLAGTVLAAGLIAGCGDDPTVSGETDPQEVLSSAFGSDDQSFDSGVIELNVAITASGGTEPGGIGIAFGGPFQSNGETELPSFDFDLTADVDIPEQEGSYEFGATVTDGSGFINFEGTEYELDAATFDQLAAGYTASAEAAEAEGAGATLAELGLNPADWLTDVTNEGVEDVEGAETVHISGAANIEAIFADLAELAASQPVPIGDLPTADEITEIADVIETADIDIYTGTDDGILRKLEVVLDLTNPDTAEESFALDLELTLSGVNEDQEISAPAGAQPITELLGELDGLGSLGGLPGVGGETPGLDSGSGVPAPADDLEACVAAAGDDPEAMADCFAGAKGSES